MASTSVSVRELQRLNQSDIPVLAFEFSRSKPEDWAPPHSHDRGQLYALIEGLMIVETARGRWMFPAQRCAWIPPKCVHAATSVGGTSGVMLYLSAAASAGLPPEPRTIGSSELLLAIVSRILLWKNNPPATSAQKRLLAVMKDEIRGAPEQFLRLPLPKQVKLARVARMLIEDVADSRTLDEWASTAGMARRTFMRAFSREMRMPFGRWRRQARLFAALEGLARGESITDVAIAAGYDSVSAFIQMFRTTLGVTPKAYVTLSVPSQARIGGATTSSPRRRS